MRRIFIATIPFIFSSSALSEKTPCHYSDSIVHGPFKNQLIRNSEIYFSESQEEHYPIYMIASIKNNGQCEKEIVIDKYDYAGGPPIIESLFFYKIGHKINAIAIISWNINSRGLGTYGKGYQVYAYENGKHGLIGNDLINRNPDTSGMEGYQEGKPVHFKLKTAEDVKTYIDRHLNHP
ncbi:hypothetical protein [Metapseudomonas otitidis]|uniref:hypothetical protein n=1 Tax=Metapseudomonas otitidis TaxID=319939 RepID=UPI002811285E|nr:hypothetical protein [Pseudomonas otitidis]WMR32244.1 hypothetical protein QT513_24215 [Pseudomonas otitidis]